MSVRLLFAFYLASIPTVGCGSAEDGDAFADGGAIVDASEQDGGERPDADSTDAPSSPDSGPRADAGGVDAGTSLVRWTFSVGGSPAWVIGSVVSVGNAGEVFVLGSFTESATVDGTTLGSDGPRDYLLLKLDVTGALVWRATFGEPTFGAFGPAMALDVDGNPVIVSQNRDPFGMYDSEDVETVIAKRATGDGSPMWTERVGPGLASAGVYVDPAGDVIVCGYTLRPTVDFGAGPAPERAFVVAKLDGATGDAIWSRSFGDGVAATWGAGYRFRCSVRASDGHVFLFGGYQHSFVFGDMTLPDPPEYDPSIFRNGQGLFVGELDGGGIPITASTILPDSIVTDGYQPSGIEALGTSTVLVGQFTNNVTFPGGHTLRTSTGGHPDGFVASIGTTRWAQPVSSLHAELFGAAVASDGRVAIVGTASSDTPSMLAEVSFGGAAVRADGRWALLLAQYSNDGSTRYGTLFGDSGLSVAIGQDVAFGPEGELLVVGSFCGRLDLGGHPLSAACEPNRRALFVASLAPDYTPR